MTPPAPSQIPHTPPTPVPKVRARPFRQRSTGGPAWLGSVLVHCALAALLVRTILPLGHGPGVPFAPTVDLREDAIEPGPEDTPDEPELPVLALPDVDSTPLQLPDDPPPDVAEPDLPPPAEPATSAVAPAPPPPDRFARIRLAPRPVPAARRVPRRGFTASQAGSEPALTPPRFAAPPSATFPTGAGSGSGRVVLRILVDAGGAPSTIVVHVPSGDPVFDLAARGSASRWRFLPALRGDTPVAAWVEVPVRYQE